MAVVDQPSTTPPGAQSTGRAAAGRGNGSAAAARLADLSLGHVLITMIGIGHRLGLLDALATGPATAPAIAARADVAPRYGREWLGALVAGGIAEYDPAARTYAFAPGYAPLLTGAP